MTRNEFIDGLRRGLSGKVEVEVVEDTVAYYEDYIDTQLKSGESEKEILEHLGKPQLIAKSIVNANGPKEEYGYENQSDEIFEGEEQSRYSRSKVGDKGIRFIMKLPGWLTAFLALLILFLLIWLCISVISFFVPVLIPIAIVLIIIATVKKRR